VITNRGAKMIAACIPNYPFLRLTPGFALTQHIALVRSEVHSILPPAVALCPVDREAGTVQDGDGKRLPEVARACVAALGSQLQMLKAQILQFDRLIRACARPTDLKGSIFGRLPRGIGEAHPVTTLNHTLLPLASRHWPPLPATADGG
jgi:hypothetical protein